MSKTGTWGSQAFFRSVLPAQQATGGPQTCQLPAVPSSLGTGVLLLALLTLGSLLCGLDEQRATESWLAAPRTGDIYTVHLGPAHTYSLLKVLRAGGNGVELVANQFQTTDPGSISTLNQDSRFSKEPFVITRLDLQIMRHKGQLIDVDRP